jgi:hypothetical protein
MKQVRFEIDEHGLEEIEELRQRLGSPNLATAIYNAVRLVLDLYQHEAQGRELRAVAGDDVRRLRLPRPAAAPAAPSPEGKQ